MLRRSLFLGATLLAACGPSTDAKKPVKTPVVSVKPEGAKGSQDKPAVARGNRKLNEAPNGDVATIVTPGNRVKILDKTNYERTLDADTLHPPAGERGLIGISPQTVTFLDDGRMMVGVGDGTLVALDLKDNPQWSVGFRGAVTGIVPFENDRVVITTQRGVVAMVNTTSGQIVWEKHWMAGALTPAAIGSDDHIYVAGPRGVLAFAEDGALVFSHAATLSDDICCSREPKVAFAVDASGHITGKELDIKVSDPHPPIVDTMPTYVFDYEKVLDEKVLGVVASGAEELILLVAGKKGREIVRYSGGNTKRFAIPEKGAKADKVVEDEKATRPSIEVDDIVMGPNGNPWVLARAVFPRPDDAPPWGSYPAKAMLLELAGTTVRERTDLRAAFDEHLVTSYYDSQIRASEAGTARLFCFGNDEGTCALYNGSQFELIPHIDKAKGVYNIGRQTYVVNESGAIERLDGQKLVSEGAPTEERRGITALGGTGENDFWYTSAGRVAYHWDGKTMQTVSVPETIANGVVAISPTSVLSRNGYVHWDGTRWSIVAEPQGAAGIVVRNPNEIWIGNTRGLFRAKPTQRKVIRLPEAKSVDAKPLEAPKPLTLGAAHTGYKATKTSLVIKNEAPVSTAKRVAVARDGTLWVEAWDRLVEVDAQGQTTVLDKEEKHITFERWFYPEGPGRGIFVHRDRESESYNSRDELRQFVDGKSVDSTLRLLGHDIVAMAGNANGTTWILGSVEAGSLYQLQRLDAEELGAHALLRVDAKSTFQTVVGLPALAYQDVSVTPEGGGFFVGSLNAGPMGEGFVLHARGPLGATSLTRYRIPATLFAVAAVSNDEAWAVGAMGLIVHIKGNTIERHVLPSGTWLRSIVATAPHDIWIGGDDGTLLHGDGISFRPVPQPLGPRAAFSGLAVSRGVVWAASPSGILRITNMGTTAPM